ncbi:hypothetical protein NL676_039892 [Syzygium grande]|nr:hypothetical protein NL676_039892 [Syzygium grande]
MMATLTAAAVASSSVAIRPFCAHLLPRLAPDLGPVERPCPHRSTSSMVALDLADCRNASPGGTRLVWGLTFLSLAFCAALLRETLENCARKSCSAYKLKEITGSTVTGPPTWLSPRLGTASKSFICLRLLVSSDSDQKLGLAGADITASSHWCVPNSLWAELDIGGAQCQYGYADVAMGTFLTHYGWNLTLEGLNTGTIMLTWLMGVEKFVNAKLLVGELGVGLRVGKGSEKTPEAAELAQALVESLSGDLPQKVRAKEISSAAWNAIKGGSSEIDLSDFVRSVDEQRRSKIHTYHPHVLCGTYHRSHQQRLRNRK